MRRARGQHRAVPAPLNKYGANPRSWDEVISELVGLRYLRINRIMQKTSDAQGST